MSEQNQEELLRENEEPINNEPKLHVPHVYVPSFTEVSENYRVSSASTEKTEPAVEVHVVEKTADVPVPSDGSDDWDQESDAHASQIVRVTVGVEPNSAPSLFHAQKPTGEEPPVKDRTLDDEKDDIHKLISPNAEQKEEEKATEKNEISAATDLSHYVLPDPKITPEEKEAALDFVPMQLPVKKVNRNFEYVTQDDAKRYQNRFLDSLLSVRVRLFTASFLTLIFALGTTLYACGVNLAQALGIGDYPFWIPLLDMQGCLCLFLLALPETLKRFREIMGRKFVFAMVYPFLFLFTVLTDLAAALTGSGAYPLFCAFFGLSTITLILCHYWDLKSAFSAFRLVASQNEKTVVEKVKTSDCDKETLALDGAIDEYRSAMAKFHKAAFVSDFQKQTNAPVGHNVNAVRAMFISAGLTVVCAVVALILGGDKLLSMAYSATLALYILPFAAYAVFALPTRLFSMKNEKEKGAVLGTSSVVSYADVDVIGFADTEVFDKDDIKIQHVRLFGESTYNDVFRDMTALFATVGGTLYSLFSEAIDGVIYPAAEPLAEKNGIAGKVGESKILAGTSAYMRKNGVVLPDEEEEKTALTNRIMYAAKNGVITAKFLISYSMSESFSMLVPHLRKSHVVPLVYTRDPNLDNELFVALMREEGALRVIKETLAEETEEVLPTFSAGVCTLGGKSVAISMILRAKKLRKFFDFTAKIAGYVFMASPLLAISLTLGKVHASAVTLLLGIWQILSFGAFAFFAERKFRSEN